MRAIYTINKRVCPMCGLPIVPQEVERQHNQEVERQRAEAEAEKASNIRFFKWVAIVVAIMWFLCVLLAFLVAALIPFFLRNLPKN